MIAMKRKMGNGSGSGKEVGLELGGGLCGGGKLSVAWKSRVAKAAQQLPLLSCIYIESFSVPYSIHMVLPFHIATLRFRAGRVMFYVLLETYHITTNVSRIWLKPHFNRRLFSLTS